MFCPSLKSGEGTDYCASSRTSLFQVLPWRQRAPVPLAGLSDSGSSRSSEGKRGLSSRVARPLPGAVTGCGSCRDEATVPLGLWESVGEPGTAPCTPRRCREIKRALGLASWRFYRAAGIKSRLFALRSSGSPCCFPNASYNAQV